jgi:hypothetical protein
MISRREGGLAVSPEAGDGRRWAWPSVGVGGPEEEYYEKSGHVENYRDPAREEHPAPPRCERDAHPAPSRCERDTLETTSGRRDEVKFICHQERTTEDAEGGEGLRPVARSARGLILLHGDSRLNLGWDRCIREEDESDIRAFLVSETIRIPGNISIPMSQTGLGFDLDRNCKVQGTNDRDLKFRVQTTGI